MVNAEVTKLFSFMPVNYTFLRHSFKGSSLDRMDVYSNSPLGLWFILDSLVISVSTV